MFSKVFGGKKSKRETPSVRSQATMLSETQVKEWQPGAIILDRYRVDQVFSGAMGRVYISEHLGWKVPLAIKAPRPEILADKEGLKRTLNEANSWVAMGMHPNVATCYYVLNIDKVPYLFIEYVDGGDLSSWIKGGRCKDPRTILNLAIQFCHGMEFTHSKGIIHRDIKPGNILITKNALLKITDFGIVQTKNKSSGKPLPQTESEKTIGFRGTPSYASPEQFADTHGVDGRSDIFSFGICLWLLFCGKRPYKNNAAPGAAVPTPINSQMPFPKPLRELLIRAVASDPGDRFQNFCQLREALNEVHQLLFRVSCPFMELDFSDLLAENLNNKAVSLFELGKTEAAKECLHKALDANDALVEGFFNFILCRWKEGADCTRLLTQVDAFRKRLNQKTMLDTLAQALRCDTHKETWTIAPVPGDLDHPVSPARKTYFPESILCLPKNSVEIFQTSQLTKGAKANMVNYLKKREYEPCYELLMTVWKNRNFQKDADLIAIYERLLRHGEPGSLRTVVRRSSWRKNSAPIKTLLTAPGNDTFFALCQEGSLLLFSVKKPDTLQRLDNTFVNEACLSTDGRFLAVAHSDTCIDLIHLQNNKKLQQYTTDAPITALAINPRSSLLLAGLLNGSVLLIDMRNNRNELRTSAKGAAVTALGCFTKADDFISAGEDGSIAFWSRTIPEPTHKLPAHTGTAAAVTFGSTQSVWISTGADNRVRVWDRQTGQCKKTHDSKEVRRQCALLLPPHDLNLVVGGDDDLLSIGSTFKNDKEYRIDARGDGVTSVVAGPTPYHFLSGGCDGSISQWMLVHELQFH